nr:MAG TPA: hypothetical protein [Caudoviricetes sp.]
MGSLWSPHRSNIAKSKHRSRTRGFFYVQPSHTDHT